MLGEDFMNELKAIINAVPFMNHPIINSLIIFILVWLKIEPYIRNKNDK